MRFSTARALLELGNVSTGDKVLDLTGGAGTICIEAATSFSNVHAVSSDANQKASTAAQQNAAAAESSGLLAVGSTIEVRCARVEDAILRSDDMGMFDVVVSELPFGVACKRMIKTEALLDTLAFVLRPKSGRAALIVPFNKQYSDIVNIATATQGAWLSDAVMRPGNVGGLRVQILLLRRGAAPYAAWNPEEEPQMERRNNLGSNDEGTGSPAAPESSICACCFSRH